VEEYIRDFKQLQLKVGLNKDPKLMIAKFIKHMSYKITNKVDLQTYLSFDDICNLAIEVEN